MSSAPILPWAEGLPKAAHLLRKGGVVAFPTETYYGLAADPRNEEALRRILAIKRRDVAQRLPLACGHESDIEKLGVALPVAVQTFLRSGWPPAFSVILESPAGFPDSFRDSIAVRVTAHPIAAHLIRLFGFPVTATSANRHGEPPATEAFACAHLEVDLVLDGGPTPGGKPSTLASPLPSGNWEILREGPILPPDFPAPQPNPDWTQDKIPACDAFVFQPARGGYRFNLDSILLVDFALRCALPVRHFLDAGSGTGVCAFSLQARCPQALGRGLELDEEACRAARIAASLQGLRNRLEFIQGDLAMEKSLLPGDFFDLVVSNPPYHAEGGRANRTEALRRARHDDDAVFLKSLFACSRRVLRPGGVLAVVLPARRLRQACTLAAESGLVSFCIQTVHPHAGRPANRVLAAFVKSRKRALEILPPLIVHDHNGYTPQLREILKIS